MQHSSTFLGLSILLSSVAAPVMATESLTLHQAKDPFAFSAKIIGGRDSENQVPFFAQVIFFNESTGEFGTTCGGSIINDKYILTAAHCVEDAAFVAPWTPEHLHVLVKNPTTNDVYTNEFKDVVGYTIHPDYISGPADLWINDVAILELRTPITDNVQSITLPQDFGDYSSRTEYQIFGVGQTSSFSDVRPASLQIAEIEPLTDAQCAASVPGYNSAETLCGNGFANQTYTSICGGDSGGPLTYIDDNGDYQQIGIASFTSDTCELNVPSVFAEILNYTSWIEGLTSDGNPIVFDAALAATEDYHSNGDTPPTSDPVPDEPATPVLPVVPDEPVEEDNSSDVINPDDIPSLSNTSGGGGSGGSIGYFGLMLLGLASFIRRRKK